MHFKILDHLDKLFMGIDDKIQQPNRLWWWWGWKKGTRLSRGTRRLPQSVWQARRLSPDDIGETLYNLKYQKRHLLGCWNMKCNNTHTIIRQVQHRKYLININVKLNFKTTNRIWNICLCLCVCVQQNVIQLQVCCKIWFLMNFKFKFG